MKKLVCFAALLAAAAGTSCEKQAAEQNPNPGNNPGEGQRITLSFESARPAPDTDTRAFGEGTTEAWEKAVNSATVFVFDAEGAVKFRRDLSTTEIANAPTTPVSLIVPDIRVGESCDFVVVANRTVPQSVTSMDLLLAETDTDAATYNGTFANATSKAMRSGGFVMTGQARQKIIEGTTKVAVTLRRTVAKVEVSMAASEAFKSKYGNATITINRISLSRGASATYLMDRSATGYAAAGSTFSSEQASSAGHNLFYIFEKAAAGEGSRVLLTVETTYDIDGSASTTADQVPVTYEVELTGAGGGKILRNGAYHVKGSIDGLTGQDLTLTVSVAPWETLQTQEVNLGQ